MTIAEQPAPAPDSAWPRMGDPWPAGRPLWVFGYGSIIYRVDFPVEDRVAGFIRGRRRAFLQRSHDHRGTDARPGRVCTLVPHAEWSAMFPGDPAGPGDVCWGVALRVRRGAEQAVKRHLDHREKDGYTVDYVDVYAAAGRAPAVERVLVYVGVSTNPSFAGPEPLDATARVIARAQGPSGTNREYLFHLCDALRALHADALDPYLARLEALVRELVGKSAFTSERKR